MKDCNGLWGFMMMIVLLTLGCRSKKSFSKVTFHAKSKDKVSIFNNCLRNWSYQNITTEQEVTVLHFVPKQAIHFLRSSNLIIGVNRRNDTIAILDKDYNDIIEI